MRRVAAALALALPAHPAAAAPESPPAVLYGALFGQVQLRRLATNGRREVASLPRQAWPAEG